MLRQGNKTFIILKKIKYYLSFIPHQYVSVNIIFKHLQPVKIIIIIKKKNIHIITVAVSHAIIMMYLIFQILDFNFKRSMFTNERFIISLFNALLIIRGREPVDTNQSNTAQYIIIFQCVVTTITMNKFFFFYRT